MSKSRVLAVLFVGLIVVRMSASGQSFSTQPGKVIATYDNRSFAHPVRLPASVLGVLLLQKETSYAKDWARKHPGGDLNRFFRATRTQLTRTGQDDWIVEGIFPLTGADCDWFWLVRSERSGPRVVLFYNGYTIHLLDKETNSLRDMRAVWESPSERDISVYHYDGVQYKLIKKYSETK